MTFVILAHGNHLHTDGASRTAREDGDFFIYCCLVAQHLAFVCLSTLGGLSSCKNSNEVSSLQLRMVTSKAMLPLCHILNIFIGELLFPAEIMLLP